MPSTQSVFKLVTQNPGVLVSVGYLTISFIGMLFSQSLFSKFGVNYFNYAEISDLLLAALREPLTFVLTGGAIVAVVVIAGLARLENRWLMNRSPKSRLGKLYQKMSSWTHSNPGMMIFAFVLYSFLFLDLYGEWKSEQIKSGVGKRVTVQLASETGDDGIKRHFEDIILLGTSNKFVFVYDAETALVDIIPIENIARLVIISEPDTPPVPTEVEPEPKSSESTAMPDPD